jgi:hypothetical protein
LLTRPGRRRNCRSKTNPFVAAKQHVRIIERSAT